MAGFFEAYGNERSVSFEGTRIIRRRLSTGAGDYGDPDICLISADGMKYDVHKQVLSVTCELFHDMFMIAQQATGNINNETPEIPLFETSDIVELILPLAYRKSANYLRDKPYTDLVKCLKLAHRLGMPLVVDAISIYLEKHIPQRGSEIYSIACQLDITSLEEASFDVAAAQFDLRRPFEMVGDIGQARVLQFYFRKMEAVEELLRQASTDAMDLTEAGDRCRNFNVREHPQSHRELDRQVGHAATRIVTLLARLEISSSTDRESLKRAVTRSIDVILNKIRAVENGVPACPFVLKSADIMTRYKELATKAHASS